MNNFLIKVYFENYRDKFYRDIIIPGRMTLDKLAYSLIAIFKAQPGYLYSFTFSDRRIVSRVDYKFCKSLDERYELDSDIPFAALNLHSGDAIKFSYGPSLSYEFTIEILDDNAKCDALSSAKIVSGAGYGMLFNLATMRQILNDEDDVIYMPILDRKVAKKDCVQIDFDKFIVDTYQKELEEEMPLLEEGYLNLPEKLSVY